MSQPNINTPNSDLVSSLSQSQSYLSPNFLVFLPGLTSSVRLCGVERCPAALHNNRKKKKKKSLTLNCAVFKRFSSVLRNWEGNSFDCPLSHLIALPIVVLVWSWCYVIILHSLALGVKTFDTRRSLVFDDIEIEANGKRSRLKVSDDWYWLRISQTITTLCKFVATAISSSTRPPKWNNRIRPSQPIPQQTAAVRAAPTNTRQPYTAAIYHCYHLLEMLPRDLLRRLTVSLHKYHSTLLPLAWDATPGLVEASYCLLTQVPFNIVTTCLRCYPGTC